jgi:hypothetical protein
MRFCTKKCAISGLHYEIDATVSTMAHTMRKAISETEKEQRWAGAMLRVSPSDRNR